MALSRQICLSSMLSGGREVVPVPPKRGPGRPPKKVKEHEAGIEDPALEALKSMAEQPEHTVEGALPEERAWDRARYGPNMISLGNATEVPPAELRIPGGKHRRTNEGPQLKLKLCEWLESQLEAMGGTDDAWHMILSAAAEEWNRDVPEIKRMYEAKTKWAGQCDERGVTSGGLTNSDAHLPKYLRVNRSGGGEVKRAKGGGHKDQLVFLYPLVKEFF